MGTFVNLARAGLPPLEAILAITVNAAEMLGWEDKVGAIQPGKLAGLVAVSGDPVADISQAGARTVRNERRPSDQK